MLNTLTLYTPTCTRAAVLSVLVCVMRPVTRTFFRTEALISLVVYDIWLCWVGLTTRVIKIETLSLAAICTWNINALDYVFELGNMSIFHQGQKDLDDERIV